MTHTGGPMSVPAPRAGPLCKRYGSLLPLALQENLLDDGAPETEALREHLAGCAYCQSILALYRSQDGSLQQRFAERVAHSPDSASAIIARLRDVSIGSEAQPILAMDFPHRRESEQPVMRPSIRRLPPSIAWLVPVAAVLLIALLAQVIFTNLHGRAPAPANPPNSLTSVSGLHLSYCSEIALISVSMLSATEGWAIAGQSACPSFPQPVTTLLLHDHQGMWSVVTFPEMHDQYVDDHGGNWKPTDYELGYIAAVSPTDVWMTAGNRVGTVNYNGTGTSYILHFNGRNWTRQRLTNTDFLSFTMFSATDGSASAISVDPSSHAPTVRFFHYDGQMWSALPIPAVQNCILVDYSDPSSALLADGEIWALGYCPSNPSLSGWNSILHFDGHTWSERPFPAPLGSSAPQLDRISMVSPQEGWIIGNDNNANGPSQIFMLQYSHGQWQPVPSQQSFVQLPMEGALPFQVIVFSMVSASDGWLYLSALVSNGTGSSEHRFLLLHDVGGVWRAVTLPKVSSPTQVEYLFGMTFLPSGEAWVYGSTPRVLTEHISPNHSTSNPVIVPLLLHYALGTWNVVLD